MACNTCFFRIFLSISLHAASICQFKIKISAWWIILAFAIYVCVHFFVLSEQFIIMILFRNLSGSHFEKGDKVFFKMESPM